MHILLRPDSITVLENNEVKERLSWYLDVMRNKKPAKYRICKKVPSEFTPEENLNDLWIEHERCAKEFKEIYKEIKTGKIKFEELENPKKSFLDLKIEIVNRMLSECRFCERKCKVDRRVKAGFCRLNSSTYVSSWFHHWGEEAPLVPSGTIFFSSCNFRCVFCQNYDISQLNPHGGIKVSEKTLAKMATALRNEGDRNINYVGGEPTPNLHTIVGSLKYMDVNVPLLWNSNMYCSEETMKILLEIIDIGLPDFKYGNNECAKRLSSVENYFEIVSRNHKIMHDYPIDMIIRHLVMPNHVECCTKIVLKWISENTPRALVNIMEQYRPEYLVERYPEKYSDINRRVTWSEMNEAYEYAEKLGICYKPVS